MLFIILWFLNIHNVPDTVLVAGCKKNRPCPCPHGTEPCRVGINRSSLGKVFFLMVAFHFVSLIPILGIDVLNPCSSAGVHVLSEQNAPYGAALAQCCTHTAADQPSWSNNWIKGALHCYRAWYHESKEAELKSFYFLLGINFLLKNLKTIYINKFHLKMKASWVLTWQNLDTFQKRKVLNILIKW